eukprot:TRINITY_DN9380_c0_g1_i1.p1 TRINITY_DN9380_c0_g1~~TRINITY_DN9380_c0_g1_i1.p1  ORF type:complete len:466 (-),score=93.84 TRINITY_DN9380_c0_g1_i1:67-1464(-)
MDIHADHGVLMTKDFRQFPLEDGFLSFYRSGVFSDVMLVTESESYRVHKLILAHHSKFFDTLFSSDFKEKKSDTIYLSFNDPLDVFPLVIHYLYNGIIELHLDNVIATLVCAEYYQIDSLISLCKDFIMKNLKRVNVLSLLESALFFNQDEIITKCYQKLATNFFIHMYGEDAYLDQFCQLGWDTMLHILRHDRLSVINEWALVQTIRHFIDMNTDELEEDIIYQMWNEVKFEYLSYEEIKQIYRDNTIPKELIVDAVMEILSVYEDPSYIDDELLRLLPRGLNGIEFEYSKEIVMRKKGIFYWLGTDFGRKDWKNPHEMGLVTVRASSIDKGNPKCLLDQSPTELWTEDMPASWFVIHMGRFTVVPTGYRIRHGGNYKADALRNWDFQGSKDGQTWVVLSRHKNDTYLQGNFSSKYWPIQSPDDEPFNQFRILQTGRNSSNRHFLVISGIEIYGEIWGSIKNRD